MERERRYVLDGLYRSLAMLSPGAPALKREDAMRLVADLEAAETSLAAIIGELRRIVESADTGDSPA